MLDLCPKFSDYILTWGTARSKVKSENNLCGSSDHFKKNNKNMWELMKWKRKGVMSSGWVQPRIHCHKLFKHQKLTFIVSKAERFLWESSCCCFTTFLRWPSEDKQNKFIVTFTRCTFESNPANACQVKVQPSCKHGTFWIYLNSIWLISHPWNSTLYFDEHTGKTSLYGKMGTRRSKST